MNSESAPGDTGGRELTTRDLELIAAFVDHRLPEEERRAFIERLDREESLYDVFVETVRLKDEAAAGSGKVIEHPAARKRWAVPATIAAALALAVVGPTIYRFVAGTGYAEFLVARGDLELAEDWYVQDWSTMRGGSRPATPESKAAVRLGVSVVDLETALRLDRDDDAIALTYQIERTLEALEFSQYHQGLYERTRELVEEGGEALAMAEDADRDLRDLLRDNEDAFELGRWAEAGKLAARSGNTRLLRSRAFRRAKAELIAGEWDPAVAPHLELSADLLDRSAREMDLAALEDAFAAIINEN